MKSGKKVNRIVSHFCFKNIVVSYSYNGDGIRYGKTVNGVTTRHVWDGANITADITGAEKTFYARGTGLIFSEANGQKQYYAFNGHGDTVSVTDAQGNLLQGYDYDAFGNEKGTAQTISNPFRYCGEYYDGETGLIYLRNRYYAPESGRFTQEDPVRDGLNWFIYCNNNPIMNVDVNGYSFISFVKNSYIFSSMEFFVINLYTCTFLFCPILYVLSVA